jgi:hypothetical protein
MGYGYEEYSIEWGSTTPIWYSSFAFFPHRSSISGKLIWLKFAYACTQRFGGGGSAIHETTWRTSQEHIIELIKGK